MTEYNYFCWSTEYNSDTSFQQKRYRVFNVEVGEDEYNKIKKIYRELDKKMWNTLSNEEKQEYFDIPHFSWEGFSYITGIEKEEYLSGKEVEVTIDGKVYKAIIK